jgi:hypothetical protein
MYVEMFSYLFFEVEPEKSRSNHSITETHIQRGENELMVLVDPISQIERWGFFVLD